jgi:hypothetical protein
MATNEDLDYDPKQTTDKVSPERWTAGAEEIEFDEDSLYDTTSVRRRRAESDPQSDRAPQFIPIPRASSPCDAMRAVPHVVQRNDSCSTHSHGITKPRESQERRLEKSSVDLHHTRMVHVDSSREAHTHSLVNYTDSLQSSGEPFVHDPPSLD